MVRVNGEKIKTYELDTQESILLRISVALNTLPKFLYFPDNTPINDKMDCKVLDILEEIKKYGKKNKNIDFDKEEFQILPKTDIIKLWIAFNPDLQETANFSEDTFTTTGELYINSGYFNSLTEFKSFWKDLDRTKGNIETEIKFNKTQIEKYDKLYKKFSNIEGIVNTDFEIERTKIKLFLKKDTTLLEILNRIRLSNELPYASCQNYFKFLKDKKPDEKWLDESDSNQDKLIVYLNSAKNNTNYIPISFDNLFEGHFTLIYEKNILKYTDFCDKISTELKVSFTSIQEQEIVGYFYFPQQRLNSYVLSDLVMNDSLFSSLLSIDESTKATKKKSDTGQAWLYLHFIHPNTGHITASIIQKLVDRSTLPMRSEDETIFPHGSPYIRVRVKGNSIQSIKTFTDFFSKFMFLYNEKYSDIVEEYEKYIPDFGTVVEYEVKELKKKTAYEAPEVFVKNYSRRCNQERTPKIRDEGTIFPRDIGDYDISYPSDGRNQKYYKCENPEYPFFGLQENKLENKHEYPVLPCCFKQEQINKPIYVNYYSGKKLQKDKKVQSTIITNKFLKEDGKGFLSTDIEKFLNIVDYKSNLKFYRIGVDRNHSSLLSCVNSALELSLSNTEMRKKMLKKIELCKQSMYDVNIETIKQMLKDSSFYIDPRLFTQAIEECFNCTIYCFSDKEMIKPDSIHGYYRKKHENRNVILIYEHWGSESDHATYPQCELIIRVDKNVAEYSFSKDDIFIEHIDEIYNEISDSYILTNRLNSISFSLENIESQYIDNYGKTRILNVNYENSIFSIATSPLYPFSVKMVDNTLFKIDYEKGLEFCKKANIEILSLGEEDGKITQINGVLENIQISIPINKTSIKSKLPLTNSTLIRSDSKLTLFNQNKKTAKYITEYFLWHFSNILENSEISDSFLNKFSKKYTKINIKHKYNDLPKIFTYDCKLFENKIFICKSEEMLKRLMYVLRLFCKQEEKNIITYKNRYTISQYYSDISEFDTFYNEIILYGIDSVEKWIDEKNNKQLLYSEIQPKNDPFFFRNNNIDDNIYIAQNTSSLESAISIGIKWEKDGYNPGFGYTLEIKEDFEADLSSEAEIYTYTNKNDIELKEPNNKATFKVLESEELFTVLLKIN